MLFQQGITQLFEVQVLAYYGILVEMGHNYMIPSAYVSHGHRGIAAVYLKMKKYI